MNEFPEWPADEPSPGFAERVVEKALRHRRRLHLRRRSLVRTGAFVMVAAAIFGVLWATSRSTLSHGDVVAADRREVSVGGRAVAVLERGAHVTWEGDTVSQSAGDVFYRVAPGGSFVVRTDAGDVTVKGTCFRVKVSGGEEPSMEKRDVVAGGAGAALALLTVVGVYEGKVAVSDRKGGTVDVRAGESAVTDAKGARLTGALAAESAVRDEEDPTMAANRSLADTVQSYRRRLEGLETEKRSLEGRLSDAEKRIAAAKEAGAPIPIDKDPFDLSTDDWKELAKTGTVKVKVPCDLKTMSWTASPDVMNKLGLPPNDAKTIMEAYESSAKRLWSAIKPLCAQALGNPDIAEKLGRESCVHLLANLNEDVTNAALRHVAEIRAGERPMPGPNEDIPTVERLFLTTTGEMKLFEADLTQAFGPDEAHRVAYSNALCTSKGQWSQ